LYPHGNSETYRKKEHDFTVVADIEIKKFKLKKEECMCVQVLNIHERFITSIKKLENKILELCDYIPIINSSLPFVHELTSSITVCRMKETCITHFTGLSNIDP